MSFEGGGEHNIFFRIPHRNFPGIALNAIIEMNGLKAV